MELKGSYKMVSLVDLEIVRDRGKRAKICCAGTCCKWQTSNDTEGRPPLPDSATVNGLRPPTILLAERRVTEDNGKVKPKLRKPTDTRKPN